MRIIRIQAIDVAVKGPVKFLVLYRILASETLSLRRDHLVGISINDLVFKVVRERSLRFYKTVLKRSELGNNQGVVLSNFELLETATRRFHGTTVVFTLIADVVDIKKVGTRCLTDS